jgi:hypothetical protein
VPDWLSTPVPDQQPLPWTVLVFRLILAAAYGGCVAVLFQASYGRRKADGTIMVTTLVLLAILVAMVSVVIGESMARAFSLVGALSIVRFRTVVEDTRDTAFVIFAVIVGMAAGAGSILVPVVGIPIAGAAALMLSRLGNGFTAGTNGADKSRLDIRIALRPDAEQLLAGVLQRHLNRFRLTTVDTAQKGTALDLKYEVQLQAGKSMATLVLELNQVEGVQSVELRA